MSDTPDTRSGPEVAPRLADLVAALRPGGADAGALLRRPGFVLGTGVGIGLAWLGGPFGTWEQMGAPQRLVYWTLAILPASVLQVWLSCVVRRLIGGRPLAAGVLAGAAGAVPAWGVVVALEAASGLAQPMTPAELFPLVVVPVVAVTVLVNLLLGPQLPQAPGQAPVPVPVPVPGQAAGPVPDAAEPAPGPALAAAPDGEGLFDRLPERLGREVICLNAQGHYLEVTTRRGRTLILMPISRAVADLDGVPGMRVHRSWWVDLRQVKRRRTVSGRVELVLTTGQVVPVARSLGRELRAALDRHGPPDLAG